MATLEPHKSAWHGLWVSSSAQVPRPVVFDLDGTLIDSRRDIAVSANWALTRMGQPAQSEERIGGYVGDGARALIARAWPEASESQLDEALGLFLDHYTENPAHHTTLVEGAREVVARLGDRPVALCTNKPRRSTEAVLAALGIEGWFASVVAGDDAVDKKPSAAPLLLVAERLGCPVANLILVGDGPQDIEAARAAGCLGVGVRGGFLSEERLLASRPEVVLDRLADFSEWLQEFER